MQRLGERIDYHYVVGITQVVSDSQGLFYIPVEFVEVNIYKEL
jgi:hypothetical protein